MNMAAGSSCRAGAFLPWVTVLALSLGGLSGCKGESAEGAGKGGSCPAGKLGCACDGSRCNSGAVCDAGYCVPTGCERGAEGCGCFADGTCAPKDGEPMSCLGNLCKAAALPEDGALGAACSAGDECAGLTGRPADCVAGTCELAGCPSGYLGCACGPLGSCAPFGDEAVRCSSAGLCMVGACEPGSLGCGCDSGSCGRGLACERGVCLSASRIDVQVNDATARSCEALLWDNSSAPVQVVFGDKVVGRSEQKAPKVGVAFFSRGDESITAAAAATLERTDGRPLLRSQVQVKSATCYDRAGQPLSGQPLVIQ